MAQPKRPRPAFSPPRPGKSQSKSKSKPPTKPKGVSKSTGRRKGVATTNAAKRSKHKSSSRHTRDLDDDEDENENEEEDDSMVSDEANESENPSSSSTDDENNKEQQDSPEPDYILAEVSHDPQLNDTEERPPAVSLPLIHRIMQEHWTEKERTKMSTDARLLVGKYVEVFVREAIMRSSLERADRDPQQQQHQSGDRAKLTGNDGWLEMEDLERIAPQLCLDF